MCLICKKIKRKFKFVMLACIHTFTDCFFCSFVCLFVVSVIFKLGVIMETAELYILVPV